MMDDDTMLQGAVEAAVFLQRAAKFLCPNLDRLSKVFQIMENHKEKSK